MNISIFKILRSLLLVLFIAFIEYKRGSFTYSGAVTGCIICFIIAYSNIVFLFVMITFVLSGSFATRFQFDVKQMKINENDNQIRRKNSKKAARDYIQVLCNGALACFYTIGYCWKTDFSGLSLSLDTKHDSFIYSIGFLFTIVCCCADTLGKCSSFIFKYMNSCIHFEFDNIACISHLVVFL